MISRQDAQVQGLKRYFTGAACANGHMAERLTSTHACVDCKRARELGRRSDSLRHRRNERRIARRNADFAAALLTETLGVPHVVVETVDPKTGRKDWQPKPKGELE